MATENKFSLPGSGYDALRKILHAYILLGGTKVTRAQVAQRAGKAKEDVSRNIKFLTCTGLITGGNEKTLTVPGQKLALAISHDDKAAIQAAWSEIITASSDLSAVLDMLKVQKGIPQAEFGSKMASHFGVPGGKSKTGVKAIVDILIEAGAIVSEGDKYVVPKAQVKAMDNKRDTDTEPKARAEAPRNAVATHIKDPFSSSDGMRTFSTNTPLVPIHINIELHLPASAEQSVYDAIFKSIRQNLMDPGNGLSDQS